MEVPTPEKQEGGLKTHPLQRREGREQQETPTVHQKTRNSAPISSSSGVISKHYNNLTVLPVSVTRMDLLSLCTPPDPFVSSVHCLSSDSWELRNYVVLKVQKAWSEELLGSDWSVQKLGKHSQISWHQTHFCLPIKLTFTLNRTALN